jgi:hypothetical protein
MKQAEIRSEITRATQETVVILRLDLMDGAKLCDCRIADRVPCRNESQISYRLKSG